MKLGKNDVAAKKFETIKEKYPESSEWNEVDKYITYAKTGNFPE